MLFSPWYFGLGTALVLQLGESNIQRWKVRDDREAGSADCKPAEKRERQGGKLGTFLGLFLRFCCSYDLIGGKGEQPEASARYNALLDEFRR